jgi:hypothetical protein
MSYATSYDDAQQNKFASIIRQYEISDSSARKIRQIEGMEIVLIIDDSGSMNTPCNPGSSTVKSITRWDEVKNIVGQIVDIASVMDKDGVDLYFLNRATVKNVSDAHQVSYLFNNVPTGSTPMCQVIRKVLQEKQAEIVEKRLLLIIFTDGEPDYCDSGEKGTETFYKILNSERNPQKNIYTTIVACTDDENVMTFLNKCDKKLTNVDVVDDYASESAEISKAQGSKYKFTYGDYIVKILIGSVDPEFDNLDEVKSCCIIS